MNLEQFKELHLSRLKEVEQLQREQEQEILDGIANSIKEERQLKREITYSTKSKSRKQLRKKACFKTKEYKFKKNYI